jgi:hypothetical protein
MSGTGTATPKLQSVRWLAVALALCALSGCGSSNPEQDPRGQPIQRRVTRTVNWSLVGKPVGNHFKIVAGVPYCTGDPKPYIEKVRIHQGEFRIIATAVASLPSEKPSDQHGCLGIFRPLYKVVYLRASLKYLKIFDGYTEPPKQEWPYRSEGRQGGRSSKVRRPARWKVVSVLNPYSVKISSSIGYCVGDPKPRYGQVQIVQTGRKIFITPYVVSAGSEKDACFGVGWYQYWTLHLNQRLAAVRLFEATTTPPSLRWPKP